MEKKIIKNKKKITFIVVSNLNVKEFFLSCRNPKIQNNSIFTLVAKFPIIKLNGNKQKNKFEYVYRSLFLFLLM